MLALAGMMRRLSCARALMTGFTVLLQLEPKVQTELVTDRKLSIEQVEQTVNPLLSSSLLQPQRRDSVPKQQACH